MEEGHATRGRQPGSSVFSLLSCREKLGAEVGSEGVEFGLLVLPRVPKCEVPGWVVWVSGFASKTLVLRIVRVPLEKLLDTPRAHTGESVERGRRVGGETPHTLKPPCMTVLFGQDCRCHEGR